MTSPETRSPAQRLQEYLALKPVPAGRGVPDDIYGRFSAAEGGRTEDTGGLTYGGVSEAAGFTREQIEALDDAKVRTYWDNVWDNEISHLRDPAAQEIALHSRATSGPSVFARQLQAAMGDKNPDGVFGSGTLGRLQAMGDHRPLAGKILSEFERYTASLGEDKGHAAYAGGWKNRTDSLRELIQPEPKPTAPGTWGNPPLVKDTKPQPETRQVPDSWVSPTRSQLWGAGGKPEPGTPVTAVPESLDKSSTAPEPVYDWDGTLIRRAPGNAQAYIDSLAGLTEADRGPAAAMAKGPIDILTSRPPMFHPSIRETARRLGFDIRSIRHAKGNKVDELREMNRPLVDDDPEILAAVAESLGPDFAINLPEHEKAAYSASKGCLMLQLPEYAREKIRAWKKDHIPAGDIVDDEDDFHTTILYGFGGDVGVKDILPFLPADPMKVGLGKLKRFPADDNRPDSDVIVLEAWGWKTGDKDELTDLHEELKGEFKVTSRYPKYNPHVTLAYVKPGALRKLVEEGGASGKAPFDDESYSCSEMVFSTGPEDARDKTTISLITVTDKGHHTKTFCLKCGGMSSCRCTRKKHTIEMKKECWSCANLNSKEAALRPDRWERLCERRGECPTCRSRELDGHKDGDPVPEYAGCTCGDKKAAATPVDPELAKQVIWTPPKVVSKPQPPADWKGVAGFAAQGAGDYAKKIGQGVMQKLFVPAAKSYVDPGHVFEDPEFNPQRRKPRAAPPVAGDGPSLAKEGCAIPATWDGLDKSAAQMVKKKRVVEETDDHCPHCDHKFREKGYPRPNRIEGESQEDFKARIDAGDYDDICPECQGIVDPVELTDEEIERQGGGTGYYDMRNILTDQREKRRQRIAARQKPENQCPHGVVTPQNTCDECGKGKEAKLINHLIPSMVVERDPELAAIAAAWPRPATPSPRMPVWLTGSPGGKVGYSTLREFAQGIYHAKEASAAALRKARNETHTDPTPAQAAAGNYRCGRLKVHGIDVALENPRGTERRGFGKDGKILWRQTMKADYGFFPGSRGADGDPVDCFLGPDLGNEFVAVVNQNINGKFDEVKVILGTPSLEAARKLYLSHYPKGQEKNIASIVPTTAQALKIWLAGKGRKGQYAHVKKASTPHDILSAGIIKAASPQRGWMGKAWDGLGRVGEFQAGFTTPGILGLGLEYGGKGLGSWQDHRYNKGRTGDNRLVRTNEYRTDYGWKDLNEASKGPDATWGDRILGHNNPLSRGLAAVGTSAMNGYQALSNNFEARQTGGYQTQRQAEAYARNQEKADNFDFYKEMEKTKSHAWGGRGADAWKQAAEFRAVTASNRGPAPNVWDSRADALTGAASLSVYNPVRHALSILRARPTDPSVGVDMSGGGFTRSLGSLAPWLKPVGGVLDGTLGNLYNNYKWLVTGKDPRIDG